MVWTDWEGQSWDVCVGVYPLPPMRWVPFLSPPSASTSPSRPALFGHGQPRGPRAGISPGGTWKAHNDEGRIIP